MDLESVIQSEVKSEREKLILYANAYIWNLKKKKVLKKLGQDRNKDADVENGFEDTGRGKYKLGEVREWNGHIYTTNCKIASGKKPHSTGRSARCFVTT